MTTFRSTLSRSIRRSKSPGSILPRRIQCGDGVVATEAIESISHSMPVREGQIIDVAVESFSSDEVDGAALIEIRALDAQGKRVPLPDWRHYSRRVGEYVYLTPGDQNSPAIDEFSVTVPEGIVRIELQGHRWKQAVETRVLEGIVVNVRGSSSARTVLPSGAPLRYSAGDLDMQYRLRPGVDRVNIFVNHVAQDVASGSPVQVTFLDDDEQLITPIGDANQNPKLGPVFVLKGAPETRTSTEVEFEVPRGAVWLKLKGQDWGSKTALISGSVTVEQLTSDDDRTLHDFVESIPSDAPLLIIDTTAPPLGHETLALRPNNLTAAYARLGAYVIFIPFGSLQGKPMLHNERVLQVPRDDVDEMLSVVLEYRAAENSTFICSSFPSLQSVTIATMLKTQGWKVVYEARDDMEEFNRVGYSKWYSPLLERRMLGVADFVMSVSTALDEKLVSMKPQLAAHRVIPNAVNRHVIDNGKALRTESAVLRRANSTTVGYVGHLTSSWFDWPLLVQAAERMPDVRFEIVGHGMPEGLELPGNVVALGPKTHDELPGIVQDWKVGLIPFKDIPLTRSVDPNKIYEYFAWGLRCVTAPMGKVHDYPATWTYHGVDKFVAVLREAVDSPVLAEERDEVERFIQGASWDDRARECLDFIDVTVPSQEA